jgi:hypothetical protein
MRLSWEFVVMLMTGVLVMLRGGRLRREGLGRFGIRGRESDERGRGGIRVGSSLASNGASVVGVDVGLVLEAHASRRLNEPAA